MDTSKVWIVIAAFNEAEVIADTVRNALAASRNVVVIDDCSRDATGDIAHASGAHVLRHPINLGQGAALQTGVAYALRQPCDYLVTFDADGQHNAADIMPMLNALQCSPALAVLGNRFLGQAIDMTSRRRRLLKLASVFTKMTTGLTIADAHNGFRVLRREFFDDFAFRQNRMAHASEILSHIARANIPFIEHPVTITYTEYSIAKGQRGSNALRIVLELLTGYLSK